MIVVFDTNIWLSELGLRSSRAAAARFYMKHCGARVAVPEVVRLEVEQNLTSQMLEHIEDIRKAHRQLLMVFGTLREVVLPTKEQVRQKVSELFDSMQVERIDIPFGLESARSSFLKTIRKQAPSLYSQQFKDGVLWADCLSLLEQDEVILVTADNAFYENQSFAKGLSSSLQRETNGLPNGIRVLSTVADLLDAVKVSIEIEPDTLQAAFLHQFEKRIFGTLEQNGFTLGLRSSCTNKVFATEDPAVLFFDFTIDIQCVDARGEGRSEILLRLRGDGSYAPEAKAFNNLRDFGEHLTFQQSDGTRCEVRSAVACGATIVLGHREVVSTVRYPLPQG